MIPIYSFICCWARIERDGQLRLLGGQLTLLGTVLLMAPESESEELHVDEVNCCSGSGGERRRTCRSRRYFD
jgi:hypothetical protein